ncbi:PspC domain-containing protein [Qipengyuania sediminis]|uniref:PspC domain-containing protein n=1 Tax=Qipengyuania sediminis TaxID=1532023 RepID=UPI001059D88B|nr:PspC domain-containing protein [Qipengyuania sediminis]
MSRLPVRSAGAGGGFRLNRRDGKVMGVSAGIADWSGMPVGFVRIAFVLGALFSLGTAALIYLAIGLIAD